MSEFDQIYRDIDNLPEEAKTLLFDFVELLKKRYPKSQQSNEAKSNFEKFTEIGLIGYCSVEENLSTSYKEALTDTLATKYDLRINKRKFLAISDSFNQERSLSNPDHHYSYQYL